MITLNLPQKGLQVLGADLNCSESIGALPTLLSRPNDSTHDALGERCTARFQSPLCPLWVISDRGDRSRTIVYVSFAPKADKIVGAALRLLCANSGPNAPQQKEPLFDHLVGAGDQRRWMLALSARFRRSVFRGI